MGELTTGRLENIANGVCGCLDETAREMARELLSLRDAGDEEVRESTTTSLNQRLSQAFDAGNAVEFSIAAADAVVYAETLEQTNERLHNRNKAQGARIKELEPELNSLSNQLREAREEIERLKERVSKIRKLDDISEEQFAEDVKGSFEENSKYIDGDIEDPSVFKIYDLGYRIGFGSAMGLSDFEEGYFSGVESLQSQIATLTAERDEARKEVERLADNLNVSKIFVDAMSKCLECDATLENSGNWSSYLQCVANNWNLRMQEACDLRDRLTSDLAALKSCPEMGEVDALVESYSFSSSRQGCKEKFLELADLARRYAVALTEEKQRADEAERLLKMAANMAWEDMCFHAEHGDEDAAKILAICGKAVGT